MMYGELRAGNLQCSSTTHLHNRSSEVTCQKDGRGLVIGDAMKELVTYVPEGLRSSWPTAEIQSQ